MNQIALLVLLLALGSYLENNSVDALLPNFYSDTGASTSLLIGATIDRVQVRVVPNHSNSTIYSVCLAYGTQLNAVYVSKYEYSTLDNSLSFVYNVSLGAITTFQAWSFPDRGSDDCISIALVTLQNEIILGPDFYLPTPLGDGPQNLVSPVRINSSSDQLMVFLANSTTVRNQDYSFVQGAGTGFKANFLSACNYGSSSFLVALGVTAGGLPQPARVFNQNLGNNWITGSTGSPARNPAVVGWPASGNFMICFDNGGNATATQVLCRASSSDNENVIDDQSGGGVFSKVNVSPVTETHAIVTALVVDITSHFRLYAVDSNTGALVSGSTWQGNAADAVIHDSHTGVIAVGSIYQSIFTLRILLFNPPNPPANSPSSGGGPSDSPSAPTAQGVPLAVQIGVGVSVSVAGAAAGLLVLLLLLKRRNKKKKQGKGDLVPMTKNNDEKTYSNVPGPYSSVNTTNESTTTGTDDSIATATSVKPSEIDERMHIPYKSLVFVKEIGSGSYGKVYLGEWRGAKVAIKVNNTVTDVDGFLAEAKLTLGIPPHPNLVQTFGVSLDGPNPCIVLEYCGGGSLDNLFDSEKSLTNEKKLEYALKIGYGLLHLHSRNVVHRDLAARNILLTNDGQPKISDFGMSRIVQEEAAKGRTKNMVGPLRWMSPENLKDRYYSLKSDVWSFGITLYEIVAGKEPHIEEDQLEIALKIRNEGATPKIPEDCNPVLRECMEMCWRFNPDDRPSMEEVCNFLRSKANP